VSDILHSFKKKERRFLMRKEIKGKEHQKKQQKEKCD
jgi:hypothetical protein